jgi:transketolase
VDLPGPVYLRLGRGRDPDVYQAGTIGGWRLGRANWLADGTDLAVLAYGTTVAPALEAARAAAADGVAVAVADMHTLKPLDSGAVARAARASRGILVAEEHNTIGGLATAVADVLADRGIHTALHRIGIPDEYAPVGPPTHLYRHYGLDAPGILARIRELAAA